MIIPYSNEYQTRESAKIQIKELRKTGKYKRVFVRGNLEELGKSYTKIMVEEKGA